MHFSVSRESHRTLWSAKVMHVSSPRTPKFRPRFPCQCTKIVNQSGIQRNVRPSLTGFAINRENYFIFAHFWWKSDKTVSRKIINIYGAVSLPGRPPKGANAIASAAAYARDWYLTVLTYMRLSCYDYHVVGVVLTLLLHIFNLAIRICSYTYLQYTVS